MDYEELKVIQFLKDNKKSLLDKIYNDEDLISVEYHIQNTVGEAYFGAFFNRYVRKILTYEIEKHLNPTPEQLYSILENTKVKRMFRGL